MGANRNQVILDYFQNINSSAFQTDDARNEVDCWSALEGRVIADMNQTLNNPFTEEEAKKALNQMHPTTAPGPDGMWPLSFTNPIGKL